jgi:hypothetical protein
MDSGAVLERDLHVVSAVDDKDRTLHLRNAANIRENVEQR